MSNEDIEGQVPEIAGQSKTPISRRAVLRAAGLFGLAAVGASVALSPAVAVALKEQSAERARALGIMASSDLVQQALRELERKGYGFDISAFGYDVAPQDRGIGGLSGSNLRAGSATHGSGLYTTIDLNKGQVLVVYATVNTIVGDGATLKTTLWGGGKRLDRERVINLLDLETRVVGTSGDISLANNQPTRIYPVDKAGNVGEEGNLACTPYGTYKECTQWYHDGNSGVQYCTCCTVFGCGSFLLPTQANYYRNCRNCAYTNYYCTASSCGGWYGELKSEPVTCADGCP